MIKYYWLGWVVSMLFLQGCAHSGLSREASSEVDASVVSYSNPSITGIADVSNQYQNASQATKGALLGGAGGGIIGGASGIGLLAGIATGAVVGGAAGLYVDQYTTLADKLENRHIKVFVLGDQVMLILPSNQVFDDRTARILPSAENTLDLVAQYINQYANMSVQVTAYTGATWPDRITRSLTQEQANNVVKYLGRRGVNTRMMIASGGGGNNLVSKDTADWNEGENYRVEITLEKLPV